MSNNRDKGFYQIIPYLKKKVSSLVCIVVRQSSMDFLDSIIDEAMTEQQQISKIEEEEKQKVRALELEIAEMHIARARALTMSSGTSSNNRFSLCGVLDSNRMSKISFEDVSNYKGYKMLMKTL